MPTTQQADILKFCGERIMAARAEELIPLILACVWAGSYHAGLLTPASEDARMQRLIQDAAVTGYAKGREMANRIAASEAKPT